MGRAMLFSMFAIGLCGCAGAISTIRMRAASEMGCPARSVQVTSTDSANPDKDDGGAYYAEGCNKIRRYTTQCDNGSCHDTESLDVLALVQKQASVDTQCDPSSLVIVHVNVDTFVAGGCTRQVSYQIQCDRNTCRLTRA